MGLAYFCRECNRGSSGVPKKNLTFYTDVVEHVKKTFNWTQEQYDNYYSEAEYVRSNRNKIVWEIDISLLTNNNWRLNPKTQRRFEELFLVIGDNDELLF
jgi:hypothetical protein